MASTRDAQASSIACDAAGRRGRRVVQLVGQAGRERAERDQGVPLARRRLDRAGGPVEPVDEVPAEGEPRAHPVAQDLGRHPQQVTGLDAAAGGQVAALRVPGAEAARPAARHVHATDDDVLAAHVPGQLEHPVDEHPPGLRRVALGEDDRAGLDRHLLGAGHELVQLGVGDAVEDRQAADPVVHRSRSSDRRQVAVHEVDGHRALADGGGDALHGVAAYVAGGEDARARWSRGRTAAAPAATPHPRPRSPRAR